MICSICDESIKEPTKRVKGDDSIYCEGYCEAWIHRRCAGLSVVNFTTLSEAGDEQTFFCIYCELQAHKAEIESLQSSITELQTSLFDLKRKFDAVKQARQPSKPQAPLPSTSAGKESSENRNQSVSSGNEKKFNIVVYGIPECPQKTNRQSRFKKELEHAIEALSKAEDEIDPSDIKDLHRLGKYDSKSERPRPLLIKFLRSNIVLDILSSKTKLEDPIYIKPDMTLHERQKERLLLKERRSLIDNGTERRYIKIRNDSIFLHNKHHCKVSSDGNKLEYVHEVSSIAADNSAASMESS